MFVTNALTQSFNAFFIVGICVNFVAPSPPKPPSSILIVAFPNLRFVPSNESFPFTNLPSSKSILLQEILNKWFVSETSMFSNLPSFSKFAWRLSLNSNANVFESYPVSNSLIFFVCMAISSKIELIFSASSLIRIDKLLSISSKRDFK